MSTMTDLFGPPIHTYSRAQAISDGVLVDVTDTAREAGFRFPVAMTSAAWADTVGWSDDDERRKPEGTGQDEAGRLWDVLWMAKHYVAAANRAGRNTDRVAVQLLRVPREGRGVRPRKAALILRVGPGDAGEPVITITLPDES
jgi:hypothetical protein